MAVEVVGKKQKDVKVYRVDCDNKQCDAVLQFRQSDLFPWDGISYGARHAAICCPECKMNTIIGDYHGLNDVLDRLEYKDPSEPHPSQR
jgi:hypothetical protein